MTTPQPELSEKDFIQEGKAKNPIPVWLWLFLFTVIVALFWGGSNWYTNKLDTLFNSSPFLRITNRELSLFLWQNPEFMRINVKQKAGYLPGFRYLDKVTMNIAYADQYAVAPPELLFRYHTWKRLISNEFTLRPIPLEEFRDFLSYVEEWQPRYWPGASKEYSQLIYELPNSHVADLSTLSLDVLPRNVRLAFQGWKNYFKEGEAINHVKPTIREMKEFLSSHPHYARNYWRNIVADSTPNYLRGLEDTEKDNEVVPSKEMASFLKLAIYNFLKSNQQ